MSRSTVLVLGGYGAFGTRLLKLLSGAPLSVHVAGRRLALAERACAETLQRAPSAATVGAQFLPVALDRDAPASIAAHVRAARVAVVVDAAGPFQHRDYEVVEAISAAGAHAIDLADAREYVTGIRRLHDHARAHGVLVASGASTVPALSVAVVDHLLEDLDALESISIGVVPGHRSPRGLATVRSILSYCGRPIPAVSRGRAAVRLGWGDLERRRYPAPVGSRWLSNVDLPDVEILAERYTGVDALELKAGLELSVLHLGLSLLSWAVARGWLAGLEPRAGAMKRVADALHVLGTTNGAMHVTVRGARGGVRIARHWELVAERDDGPYVPAAAASVLTKRLCGVDGYAPIDWRGATPCVGLLHVDELLRELSGRSIRIVQHDERL